MADLSLSVLRGDALATVIPDIARLRVTVFREWPYLYDGTEAYEMRYLQTYVSAPGAAVVVARDEGVAVGASTCLPLTQAAAEVRAPFLAASLPLEEYFYFGESVLLGAYRGRGLGVAFFEQREAQARHHGQAKFCTFCAVVRPQDHKLRPPGAAGLDRFWTHRGYRKQENLVCHMRWRDIGADEETEKPLVFWMKPL